MSYEPIRALARSAEQHSITFPLLSDEGSHVIHEFGLERDPGSVSCPLDPSSPQDRKGGLHHPGTVHLDADGAVTAKQFEADRSWVSIT